MAKTQPADLLVLAAHSPELIGLSSMLGPTLAGAVNGVRVVCATVGVGLAAAGVGAMRALRETRPRAVVLLGSCGLYPRMDFEPLVPVIPRAVQLVEPSVLAGKAAFPGPMQTSLGYIHREVKGRHMIFGQTTQNDTVAAFTFSIRPGR